MTTESDASSSVLPHVTAIVAAYVSNNSLPANELPALMVSVHRAVSNLALGVKPETENVIDQREPAVSIRKSITPDYLICLDDGKKYRSLKRHLGKLGMTPDEYRAKWKLPSDYPMVAQNYAAARSELAKKIGLGKPFKATAKALVASKKVSAPVVTKNKVGRPKRVP